MVWNWFFRDAFVDFEKRLERLDKFVRIAQADVKIEHYQELKSHLRKMFSLLPTLKSDLEKEVVQIAGMPPPMAVNADKLLRQIRVVMQQVESYMGSMLGHVELALEIRVPAQTLEQKQKLEKAIVGIIEMLQNLHEAQAELLVKSAAWKVQKGALKRAPQIEITGRLSNGWRLADIQRVVVSLGGRVEETRGGAHPYRIVFEKQRPIPLAESTPWYMLVREVSKATGFEKKNLIMSFHRGALLAA